MSAQDACSICAECISPTESSVRLECSHLYHAVCIVQWFRYYNDTCPLCRSNDIDSMWREKTPLQRIALMRVHKLKLPKIVQRKLSTLQRMKDTGKTIKKDIAEYKSTFHTVLKRGRKLEQKSVQNLKARNSLIVALSKLSIPEIPHLSP